MEGLPHPSLLREYSLRCRIAAGKEADRERRHLFARHALTLAQLAEAVERKLPLAAAMPRDAIVACEAILGGSDKAKASVEAPQPIDAGEAALHRASIWREKAADCRAVGEQMMFRDTRAIYLRLADDYETMARREEGQGPTAMRQAGRGRSDR